MVGNRVGNLQTKSYFFSRCLMKREFNRITKALSPFKSTPMISLTCLNFDRILPSSFLLNVIPFQPPQVLSSLNKTAVSCETYKFPTQ